MEQSQISIPYSHAAEIIKIAILQGQYEALKGENRIQLAVYFSIGRYVSQNSRKDKWGTGALAAISEHLRKILPGLRGFSAESLKKMRLFYEGWMMLENGSSVSGGSNSVIAITELEDKAKSVIEITETDEIDIYHAMVIPNTADFPATEFLAVPFTHHSRILSKTKTLSERYYYIRRCAQEHLSVDTLVRLMEEEAYRSQQFLPNNFSKTIPSAKEARRAVMMFKDEYALDFINVEEIGERDNEDIDLRTWLQFIPNRYIHFGDFDLAGIHIFLSEFYAHLGDRVEFLIPNDVKKRIASGNRMLYDVQYAKYRGRKIADQRLLPLVELIHRYRRVYEQEGYIKEL